MFFLAADVPEGVTKKKLYAAVKVNPAGSGAAGEVVLVVAPPSVDFFLILKVDP